MGKNVRNTHAKDKEQLNAYEVQKTETICGVECYEKDGTAYLKLETVARGLGFTRIAESGNEVVRWERIGKYLEELGFMPTNGHDEFSPQVGKTVFIPENIFYRLAMKAKNETAEAFQAMVADEIIPSIRKHGIYATDDVIESILDNPDFGIQLLEKLKEERSKNKVLTAENTALAQEAVQWGDRATINALVRAYGGHLGGDYSTAWRDFKKELLYKHGINLNARLTAYLNESGKKTKPKTLDMLHEHELPQALSTAIALCRNAGVDIDDIIASKIEQ